MTQRPFHQQQLLTLVVMFILAVGAIGIPEARAQYTDIHDFDTPSLASPKYAGLLAQGLDGNLYGTARSAEYPAAVEYFSSRGWRLHGVLQLDGALGSNPTAD